MLGDFRTRVVSWEWNGRYDRSSSPLVCRSPPLPSPPGRSRGDCTGTILVPTLMCQPRACAPYPPLPTLSSLRGCGLLTRRRDGGGGGKGGKGGSSASSDRVESTDPLRSGRDSAAVRPARALKPFLRCRIDSISLASSPPPPLLAPPCCLFFHRIRNMIPITRIRMENPVTIPRIRPMG